MAARKSRRVYSNKQPRNDLTAEYVRSIINYDPSAGLIWHKARTIRPDHVARDKQWNDRFAVPRERRAPKKGYLSIKIDGVMYAAHRVAWLHYHGSWPEGILDHENTNRGDLRIENLREATFSKNTMNSRLRDDNHCGIKGIGYLKRIGKWRARIGINGRNIYLGVFETQQEAAEAYRKAAHQLHGEFARAA